MTAPRVLIVEDDPRLGPIMSSVLSQRWQVTLAASAEQAVDLCASSLFDVLIVDRRLPGASGIDLIRTLRLRRIATPIIMLTALGELDDWVSGLDAGADDYLVKPFEFAELEARLRAHTRNGFGDDRDCCKELRNL